MILCVRMVNYRQYFSSVSLTSSKSDMPWRLEEAGSHQGKLVHAKAVSGGTSHHFVLASIGQRKPCGGLPLCPALTGCCSFLPQNVQGRRFLAVWFFSFPSSTQLSPSPCIHPRPSHPVCTFLPLLSCTGSHHTHQTRITTSCASTLTSPCPMCLASTWGCLCVATDCHLAQERERESGTCRVLH